MNEVSVPLRCVCWCCVRFRRRIVPFRLWRWRRSWKRWTALQYSVRSTCSWSTILCTRWRTVADKRSSPSAKSIAVVAQPMSTVSPTSMCISIARSASAPSACTMLPFLKSSFPRDFRSPLPTLCSKVFVPTANLNSYYPFRLSFLFAPQRYHRCANPPSQNEKNNHPPSAPPRP